MKYHIPLYKIKKERMGCSGKLLMIVYLLCVLQLLEYTVSSSAVEEKGTVLVDGRAAVGTVDEDFICATLDWWPTGKCDFGACTAWDHASILNLDLKNTILQNAVKALAPLRIRLGGTLQDLVTYETPGQKQPCLPFTQNSSHLFSYTPGCLPMRRWNELNAFFRKTGAKVIFGLNALSGRSIRNRKGLGAWDYTNAESFIRFTAQNNHTIDAWELGNELCGAVLDVTVTADQYAKDTINLRNIVNRVYKNVSPVPLVVGPGGFYEATWYAEYLNKAGDSLSATTRHIYNLGPANDKHLVEKILNPSSLDNEVAAFRSLEKVIKTSKTKAVAWVSESGGAYGSGRNLVSNAFVYSFWYLDQLGTASVYDTKVFCRQSLIGGNYGLLNNPNFTPNPDFYSALIWKHLMGRKALFTSFSGTKKLRTYTHCAKQSKGITVLLMNLDATTAIVAKVELNNTHSPRHTMHTKSYTRESSQLPLDSKGGVEREEYHLTAKDGNLHSQTMLLNGNALEVSSKGDIPPLKPIHVNSTKPITIAPYSIVFVHMSDVVVPACA